MLTQPRAGAAACPTPGADLPPILWPLALRATLAAPLALPDPPPGVRADLPTVGPDLVRIGVEDARGRGWIELTPDRGGSALCRAGGLALQLRTNLDGAPDDFDLPEDPPAVAWICAELPTWAAEVRAAMAASTPLAPTPVAAGPAPPPPARPAGVDAASRAVLAIGALLALGWGLGGARRAPRAALGLLGLTLGALGLRARHPPTALLGGDAAYERLVGHVGRGSLERYYGEGWGVLVGGLEAAARGLGTAERGLLQVVPALNLGASALAPALTVALGRGLGLPAPAAALAGLGLALWPAAASLGAIEDHFPVVSALQLVIAAGAAGVARSGRLCAGVAAGLLAHLRTEQLPVAALLLLPAVRGPGGLPALVLGGSLIGLRLTYLPELGDGGPVSWARWLDPRELGPMLHGSLGVGGPLAWPLLALAAVGLVRGGAPALALGPALLLQIGLYAPKTFPAADPLRFMLPLWPLLAVLAAHGAGALLPWARLSRARAVGGAAVIGLLTQLPTPRVPPRPWAWELEHQLLRAQLPALGAASAPGARLWYHPGQDPHGAFGRWLGRAAGRPAVGWGTGIPQPGDLVLRGTADALAAQAGEAEAGQACALEPLFAAELTVSTDGWVSFPYPPRFALARVRDCPL